MIKQNKFKIIISSVITLLPMIFGFIVWDRLPEEIATSFGWNGEAVGYSSKMFAVVGLFAILTLVNLICIIATNADPRIKNIDNKIFSIVISIVPACSLICGACIFGNALGYRVDVQKIMPVFVGAIILVLGFLLPECKQNYTIGIKLPWTLHNEENWDKTHKFAGRLWVVGGIIMTISGLLNFKILFMIIIFAIVIIPTVYSYLLYRNK
ncbi:MAG: SdpI family protein [Clostridia bacterium]|nr:SdpI family protein [Clostridia bacterium]